MLHLHTPPSPTILTPSSASAQATGLADLVHSLFGYKRIATVASTDAYGAQSQGRRPRG